MKKKVIVIVSEQVQADACGFIIEFKKLGGHLDGIVCLLPKKSVKGVIKKNLRFLKKLTPTSVLHFIVSVTAAFFNMRTISQTRLALSCIMPSTKELLSEHFNLFKYAAEQKIPFHFSPALTSGLVKQLTSNTPVIFPMYAGGIWGKELLETPGAEFINAHMGEMPQYRGMNVIEWAILEGSQPKVAVMVLNDKIDGGDVLLHKNIPIDNIRSVFELRKQGFTSCFGAMAEGIYKYQQGETLRTKQSKGAKYYYRMHSNLKKKVEAKLIDNK